MRAGDLTDEHLGMKVSYGPANMFTGVLVRVVPMGVDWWDTRDLENLGRVHITTADGRSATLADDTEVGLVD